MKELKATNLQQAISYIDSWLEFNFADSRIVGLQVGIQHEDDILYNRAFGHADIEANEKMSTTHAFRVASHSKTFTATAIMQLAEQDKLVLDDPVSKYLPWFSSEKDKLVEQVTIRQLLSHTAGLIRDGEDADYWQLLREYPNVAELKEYILGCRLIYPADKRFKYSNYGFGYLGFLIEEVSGTSYADYMKRHIIEPLGLKLTGADIDGKNEIRLATGYGHTLLSRPRKPFQHVETHALVGATGFYSCAEDLCKYFRAHMDGDTRILSEASKSLMRDAKWESEKGKERYGLGLISYSSKEWQLYGHGGGFPGFLTHTKFDPHRKIVISVLSNSFGLLTESVNATIYSIIGSFAQAKGVPNADHSKFTGRFYSKWGPTDIVQLGDKLIGVRPRYWSDFQEVDTLTVVDDKTLLIADANGYESPGELVKYDFTDSGRLKSIKYAGISLLSWEEAQEAGWF